MNSTSSLESMCELVVDCPHFTPEWTDSGYLVIRNQNIRDGKLDLSQPSFTHGKDFRRRIKRAKPRAGDIIFTREAPMGEICLIPEGIECCVGQRQVLLRPRSDVDGRFLFYALRSPYVRDQIFWNEGTGSTVSNVRIPVLKSLKIPRLGTAENEVAEVLGLLDDKIELNRRMNATLEGMAQAIFRDWFVDFGPTRRKQAGVNDPVQIMGNLLPDPTRAQPLADLFPVSFGENGLPEGWEEGTLNDIARQIIDTVSPSNIDAETPYIGLEHMPRRSIALNIWEAASKVTSNKARFRRGQILFGKLRPYFHKVGIAPTSGVCSTDIVVLDARDPVDRARTIACVSTDEFVAFTDQSSTGTKMPRTSWKIMKTFKLAKSPRPVSAAFSEIVEPMIERILSTIQENQTLTATRDLLLPKLMSGEIRLDLAEKAA